MNVVFESAHLSADGVYDVSPEETLAKLKHGEIKVIDVRRPDEWTGELGHVQGASFATLETDLGKTLDTLSPEETYVFVCRSGGRSTTATARAQSKGLKYTYNMLGGMILWNRLGLPVSKTI